MGAHLTAKCAEEKANGSGNFRRGANRSLAPQRYHQHIPIGRPFGFDGRNRGHAVIRATVVHER
jgi:hypothetical protein